MESASLSNLIHLTRLGPRGGVDMRPTLLRVLTDLYVHMGFHPAWKFKKVYELLFQSGTLTHAHDRSAQMRAFREEMKDRNLGPQNPDDHNSIEAWVKKSFSLDYR